MEKFYGIMSNFSAFCGRRLGFLVEHDTFHGYITDLKEDSRLLYNYECGLI